MSNVGVKSIDDIKTDIGVEKEILSTMPRNNEKNKDIYIKKIEELKKQYMEYNEKISIILRKKFEKMENIKSNKEIENLSYRLKTIENALRILNDKQTSYEKMGLDRNIYNLEKYYKADLNSVNEQIYKSIEKFRDIGIDLKNEDFCFSKYSKEYMQVFFEEVNNNLKDSEKLKMKFEEVYWKCPEIIMHIALSFRNIYLSKKSEINKFYEKKKNEILKQWGKTPNNILEKYFELKKEEKEKREIDKKIIVDKFLKEELNTKNYTEDKFKSNCLKIMSKEMCENIEKDKDLRDDIKKFLNSLYEYKNLKEFSFLLNDVKKYYENKDEYKKIYDQTKSQIEKKEKELKKNNKKANGFHLFGKNVKDEKQSAKNVQLINEISELYKRSDIDKFSQIASNSLTENTTIFDVLKLSFDYYDFLVESMIKNDKEITQEEINEKIKRLDRFIKNPYNNLINNITFLEDKNMAMIIKDRYKLLNFNVEIEDFNEGNIESLISTLENIQIYFNMKKAKIKVEEMEQMVKIKKLLNLKY